MVGKKIRCRTCARVFVVESREAASSSSSTMASGFTKSRAGQNVAGAGGSAAGVTTVLSRPKTTKEHVGPAAAAAPSSPAPPPARRTARPPINRSMPRPSEPQPFQGSEILEAWLPLGLCLIAAVWVPSLAFSDNHIGAAWAALLRIAMFAAIYFLLVAPITFFALKKSFLRMRRFLPPQPRWRVISTFIFPATLAYVFSMLNGGVGFLTGALLGLVFMSIVFWLMFRLEPQETANVYAVVGGTFFGACVLGMLLLIGVNAALNRMVSANSGSDLRESPLGPQFAWTQPAAAPTKVDSSRHERADSSTSNDSPTPQPSSPDPTAPAAPHPEATPQAPGTPGQPAVKTDSQGAPAMADGTTPGEDPDLDPALKSGLFGGGGVVEGDPLVKGIQDAKLPWVKWVYRPADQGIYEQTLGPVVTSPFVAMFRLPGIGGRTVECCRLTPLYRGMGAIPLGDEGSTDAVAVTGRYAITEDGAALLRLTNAAAPKVEILPFRGPGGSVTLATPPDFARADAALVTPELLGTTPGRHFLIRWASGDLTVIQLYDFNSAGGPKLSLKLGQNDWPAVYAISPDGSRFAAPEREADRTFIAVRSLTNSAAAPMLFPASASAEKARQEPTGISFSPDGSRMAALFERGTDGTVSAWTVADELRLSEGVCKVPSADEMLGQVKGRAFDWIAGGKWLVHGRTLMDATTGAISGSLTDQVVTAQQMADDHTVYLSYLGPDGHPHMAVVKFNPAALTAPPPPGSGSQN